MKTVVPTTIPINNVDRNKNIAFCLVERPFRKPPEELDFIWRCPAWNKDEKSWKIEAEIL